MSRRIQLLLIEPNACHVELVTEALSTSPVRFVITVASSLFEAERLLRQKHRFDLVVVEGEWADSSSKDWLSRLKSSLGSIPIVMLSCKSDEVKAVAFMKMGVDDYLVKRRDTLKKLPQLLLKHLHKKRKKEDPHGIRRRMGKGMTSIAQNLKLLAELINQPSLSLKKGGLYLKQRHGLEKEIETLKGMIKNWMGG